MNTTQIFILLFFCNTFLFAQNDLSSDLLKLSKYYDCLEKGVAEYQNENYEKALNYFNSAILYVTNDAQVYYFMGVTYSQMKNHENAIVNYNRCLSIDSNYIEAYEQRAISKYFIENYESAIRDFQIAIRFNPNKAVIFYYYALVLIEVERNIEACEKLKTALSLGYTEAQHLISEYCK